MSSERPRPLRHVFPHLLLALIAVLPPPSVFCQEETTPAEDSVEQAPAEDRDTAPFHGSITVQGSPIVEGSKLDRSKRKRCQVR
jgi:hypothetical protein